LKSQTISNVSNPTRSNTSHGSTQNLVDNIPSPSKHEEEEKEIKIEAE